MAEPFDSSVICPILIGRANHLEALERMIPLAHGGQKTARIACIAGEAGIGKSRLVAVTKALATQSGCLIIQGNCFEPDSTLPYAPFLDLLHTFYTAHSSEDITRAIGPNGPDLVKLLPELQTSLPAIAATPTIDLVQEKHRLFQALSNFFTRLANIQPLLIVVEDLHWSDELSLEFLLYLARHLASEPILLLLTYRSDEVHAALNHFLAGLDRERLAVEVELVPLNVNEIDGMLQAIFGFQRPLHAEFLATIHDLTDGNPFFIEEILKVLLTAGDISYVDEAWDAKPIDKLHIPRSVQDAVQRRSKGLSAAAHELLVLAAVAGQRFDFKLLQDVTRHMDQTLLLLIKELIAAQLVIEESAEQFAFRHALTRQAVYSNLLARERKALHRQIAESIENLYHDGSGPASPAVYVSDLAYHFYQAGSWPETLKYSQWAGDKAQTLHAPREAIEHFTHVLAAAYQLSIPVPLEVYRERARAYETLGDFTRALMDSEQVLVLAREASDGQAEWQALIALGFLWTAKDYSQTGNYFQRALQLAHTLNDLSMQAGSLNRLGNWLVNTGATAEALQSHREALAFFEAQQDRVGTAETLDLLGMANFLHGDMPAARDYSQRAINLFVELSDKRGPVSDFAVLNADMGFAETVLWTPRTLEDCEHAAAAASNLARQLGWLAGQAQTEWTVAIAVSAFGDFGRGLAHAHDALQIATEIEHWQWVAAADNTLGQIYTMMLQPELAIQNLVRGLPLAYELGSAFWIGNISTYLALAHLLKGETQLAEAALREVMPVLGLSQDWHNHPPRNLAERRMKWAWGQVVLAQGRPELALELVEQLVKSVPGLETAQRIPALLSLKGDALVALHRLEEAEQVLQEGKLGAQERQARPFLWKIHRSLGDVFQRLRQREQAEHEFAAARDVVQSLALTIVESTMRENFLDRALATLPQDKPISARRAANLKFRGLTQREREVTVLITQGKSNREIADTLVLSKRTIEVHISNIMSKLGFTTRVQIAAWAVEIGLLTSRSE